MNSGLLQGRTALITGAAGAIGSAIARGFAAARAKLCLIDIDGDRLARVAAELKAARGDDAVLELVSDVRDAPAARHCVEQAAQQFEGVDILVNNAGVTRIGRIDELEDSHIDEIIDTDLKAYFYYAREFVRQAKNRQAPGVILIVSSKNGLEGASEKSLYSAAKSGEIAMARALARELGPFGIRVNVICPDAVHKGSKLWERGGHYSLATAKRYNITEDEIPEYYRKRCALKTSIEPEDVANAALFLCTEQSAKITGAVLTVDGGVAFAR
ncbi:MAG TPA: SDR family oxidoreductase [Candidatus Hydrogenedentes bacterium]|nr:SDR family oxidoreductase [Candidatus Hydrogenedentota bacterium]